MIRDWMKAMGAAVLTAGLVFAVGCDAKKPTEPVKAAPKKGHDGWWCDEHGVPEDGCTMCDDKALKEAEKQGKLCPNHPDRSKDQCFICNPDLWPKSAQIYKDKEGKDPPFPDKNAPGGKKE
jgi:hypothetical protein